MKRLLQMLLFVIGIITIAVLDVSVVPFLGSTISSMNIALVVSVFLLIVIQESLAFFVFWASTILIHLSASHLLIVPLLIGTLTLFVVELLFESFFTNRSYYSLVLLGIVAWSFYYGLFALAIVLFYLTGITQSYVTLSLDWLFHLVLSLGLTLCLYSLAYLATSFVSKRFRSYFILSE